MTDFPNGAPSGDSGEIGDDQLENVAGGLVGSKNCCPCYVCFQTPCVCDSNDGLGIPGGSTGPLL